VPPKQSCPHAPQFFASALRSAHTLVQSVVPDGQAQVVPEHVAPALQLVAAGMEHVPWLHVPVAWYVAPEQVAAPHVDVE